MQIFQHFHFFRPIAVGAFFVLMNLNQQAIASNENEFSPFFVNNVLPISIGLGLPKTLSANTLEKGQKKLTLNLGVKSNANDAGSSNGEMLQLDGETYSLDVGFTYGLTRRWQLDAQISYLRHTGGSLDNLIDSWHDFFSLDDGDRPLFEQDQFQFSYSDGNVDESIDESVDGISDLRVGLGYLVKSFGSSNVFLRAGLSLPTGDADKLTGSDDVDADIGIYTNGRGTNRWRNLGWHANLGYLIIGDDQALGVSTQSGAWFSSLGGYWAISQRLVLKSQFDLHGSFFESGIDELASSANEVTVGFAYKTKKSGSFDVFFSEDISVNRGADFSFGVSHKILF